MDLYIQPLHLHEFTKQASETTLPEDTNAWPNEIMQELFKSVPYVSDFEPQVVMDRVDPERAFAFGHIQVQNKTELQQAASPEALQAVGVQSARIPIIVRDRKLQPFDVIITSNSKAVPLTERRMREVLFRPQTFDVTSRTPGDMSMVGQLYPPYRQNYGFGGGGVGMSVGMGKEGSALEQFLTEKTGSTNLPNAATTTAQKGPTVRDLMPKVKIGSSILAKIASTINPDDYASFANTLMEDKSLQALFHKNASAMQSVLPLLDYTPLTAEKMANAISNVVRPDVFQLQKVEHGYLLKTASHHFWEPKIEHLDRGQAVALLDEKMVLAADASGSVTTGAESGVSEEGLPEAKPELITHNGTYKVKDDKGQELVGLVFPNLLDCDGTALPIALFTNGSVTALQEAIAGELTSTDATLLFGPVGGHGCFVRQGDGGEYEAMVPMTVLAGYSENDVNKQHVETYDGRRLFVAVQPNVEQPVMSDDTCIIPMGFKWMPLGGGSVSLVAHPEDWGQSKQASRAYASVTVRAGDENFSFSGLPLSKFAAEDLSFLSVDDALFLLAGLGTDLEYGAKKLASSFLHGRPETVRIGRHIKLASEMHTESLSKAASYMGAFPNLRISLIKEAAYIPDPLAVDTVLSIGFINPENIMTFVGYLPQLDEAQSKLCELLVASRLGLAEVPTSPLEKSIKSLEEVIEGLRILAFQKS